MGLDSMGTEIYNIHEYFRGLTVGKRTPDFWVSQLGIRAWVYDYIGLDGHGSRLLHSLCI